MKNLIFTAMLIGLSFSLIAQPAAKSFFIGGSVGYSSTSSEQGTGNPNSTSSTFSVLPTAGYFLSDKLAVGLGVGIVMDKDDNGATVDKATGFGLSPYVQFYKPIGEGQFSLFAEGGLQYSSFTNKPDGGPNFSSNAFGFYIAPGFAYFFDSKWALDFKLQAVRFSVSDPNTDGGSTGDKDTELEIGLSSLNPSLGFRYFFNR
jgi:hypothetical protein